MPQLRILERVVCSHQIYKRIWIPVLGERLHSKNPTVKLIDLSQCIWLFGASWVWLDVGVFVDGRKYRQTLTVDLSAIDNDIMSSTNARKRGPVDKATNALDTSLVLRSPFWERGYLDAGWHCHVINILFIAYSCESNDCEPLKTSQFAFNSIYQKREPIKTTCSLTLKQYAANGDVWSNAHHGWTRYLQ